jgi:hypothetical protein
MAALSNEVLTVIGVVALAAALVALVLASIGWHNEISVNRQAINLSVSDTATTDTLRVKSQLVAENVRSEDTQIAGTVDAGKVDTRALTALTGTVDRLTVPTTLYTREIRIAPSDSTVVPPPPPQVIELGDTHVSTLYASTLEAGNVTMFDVNVSTQLLAAQATITTLGSTSATIQSLTGTSGTMQTLSVPGQLNAQHATIHSLEVTDDVKLSPVLSSLQVASLAYTKPQPAHVSARAIDPSAPGFVPQTLASMTAAPLGLNQALLTSSLGPLGPSYLLNASGNNVSAGGQYTVTQGGLYMLSATFETGAPSTFVVEWTQGSGALLATTAGDAVNSVSLSGAAYLVPGSLELLIMNTSGAPVGIVSGQSSLVLLASN